VLVGNLDYEGVGGTYGGTLNNCTLVANSGDAVYNATLNNCSITGNGGIGANSCTLNNCTLATNASGGAIGSTLTNCAITANGGIGGGASACTLDHCTLTGNSGYFAGGGAEGGTLNHCTLLGNIGLFAGGGAHNATLNDCTLISNLAGFGGGANGCTLNNCTLIGNVVYASLRTSGTGGGAYGSTLNNCTLTGNSASAGGGAFECTLNNCTLSANEVHMGNGPINLVGSGAYRGTLNNCIVYDNIPAISNYTDAVLNYCCTTPLPSGGLGNFTNAPLFVDAANGNLRLQSNSPCINSGLNAYAPAGPDLDGLPRIVGGTVDVGAYEFQSPQSVISYAWLQNYGLPTDGSADLTDTDGDGMNNWKEWRCLTDPTSALSALRLLSPTPGSNQVTLSWQSVAGVNYFLERSTNVAGPSPVFMPVAQDLLGQVGVTRFTDTNTAGLPRLFYHVGVK
jgi:hypothetical protein